MHIKSLIVDDEPLAIQALEALLQKIPGIEVTGRCQDAVEAMQWIHDNDVDLVFLDIHMPEISGIGLLKSLANPPKVIFTTAYREYAVEAFELDVIDYLVKPVSLERLLKAVDRYHERTKTSAVHPQENGTTEEKYISIYTDKKTYKVAPGEILYIEGLKDYAIVHTGNEKLITRQTLKKTEELLADDGFIRVHRSYIVPLNRIRSWSSYSLNISGKEIPIGKTYRKAVMQMLGSPD